jgi:hypothetical protein
MQGGWGEGLIGMLFGKGSTKCNSLYKSEK